MKCRIHLRSILSGLALMAAFVLVACTDEFAVLSSQSTSFDESDIMETQLGVSVNEFAVSTDGTTRADEPHEEPSEDTEIMSDFEKTVDNIWVFQYGTDGNLVIKPRYYTAKESETDGTWSVLLKPVASNIYVVTNVNDSSWALNDDSADFMTAEKLMTATLSEPYTIYDLSDDAQEGHIPMQGHVDDVTPVSGGEAIIVPVEHMYAKVKVRVVIDKLLEPYEPSINSVSASNCPYYCRIGTLYDMTANSQDEKYPSEHTTAWVSRSMMKRDASGKEIGNNTNDPNNTPLEEAGETPYEYVIYIPENIQGEVTVEERDANAKADNLPKEGHPTSIVVEIEYTASNGSDAYAHYTVYPGGNNYNNFNIRRNQVYRVTMLLGAPETEHTPSANCIVGHPGKTISFEPYYRVETGGGYDFSDYLSPDDPDKTIKGYKILWQTYECIGDNSDGSLVTFELDEASPINSKFYVHVNEPGNAVIAAYADENCTGEIIWSWHIWVTSEDPTNISNAVTYYTYPWDSEGIYGVDSGRARIPGYGMMSCNLGALASSPETEQDLNVLGMNYQWGRKDPFPPSKIDNVIHAADKGCLDYSVEIVGQLYDNSHKPTIEMTAKEGTNEMFRSISGNTIIASSETYGVKYTIAHPTQFMCGSYEAGDTSFVNIAGTLSNYHNQGDWLPSGQSDNKLWGALEITEDMMSYTIDSSRGIHLYDDYGTKSIFDPCPYGWRVSSPDQWLGFTKDGGLPAAFTDINTVTTEEKKNFGHGMLLYIQDWKSGLTSFFPTPGMRCGNGCSWRSYSCGNYHNASADESNRVNILHVHDTQGNFAIFEPSNSYTRKSIAGPVRCVRDKK